MEVRVSNPPSGEVVVAAKWEQRHGSSSVGCVFRDGVQGGSVWKGERTGRGVIYSALTWLWHGRGRCGVERVEGARKAGVWQRHRWIEMCAGRGEFQ